MVMECPALNSGLCPPKKPSPCVTSSSSSSSSSSEDPSIFWDNHHHHKINPNSLDSCPKQTRKPLLVHVGSSPAYVKDKLKDHSSLYSTVKVIDDDGLLPKGKFQDQIALINLIKSCAKEKNIWKARAIHADILKDKLLAKDVYIANTLITTYFKCGASEDAHKVFEQIPIQNVVSWNALISGYAKNGFGDQALKSFLQMKDVGVFPNPVTYICTLKACGIVGSLEIGEDIYAEVKKQGLLEKNAVLGTALVDMYCKCGFLEKARQVFERLPEKNVVSWSALIAGYAQNGFGYEALECFKQMKDMGLHPDVITYISVLKACGIVGSLDIGKEIDREVRNQGLLQKDGVLGNVLVDMYSKCSALNEAQEVFEQLPVRNIVTWNALISGYAQNKCGNEALKCFGKMKDEGVFPDVITYTCILKACGIVRSLEIGEAVDADIRKQGLLEKDPVLGNALVDMYCRCGAMDKARAVFEELPERNGVAWSALIAGYAHNGLSNESLKCFRQMKAASISPSVTTYLCVLKTCATVGSLEMVDEIYAEIKNQGLWGKDVVLGTALVDIYSKCVSLDKAREVFEQLPVQNVMSWSALIGGYSHNGLGEEALTCFGQMRDAGICPDKVTYLCILKACGIVGSLEIGEEIHGEVRKQGLLCKDVVLGNALVDMYSKCAELDKAQEVFEHLPERNVVSWSALVAGYGQLGKANVAFDTYTRMRAENIVPNSITFVILLNACSHAGLLKEGERLFDEMCVVNCVTPTIEHYTCMADLFCRAGCINKVQALLDKVPHVDHHPLFQNILGSCGKWGNVKLGRWAFQELLKLDEKCGVAYICMENVYAAGGIHTEPISLS